MVAQSVHLLDRSTYGIRCCSHTKLNDSFTSTRRPKCLPLWVTSNDFAENQCVHSATFFDAVALCEAHGARLCTAQENLNDCTKPAKCGLNQKKVWTSTPLSGI